MHCLKAHIVKQMPRVATMVFAGVLLQGCSAKEETAAEMVRPLPVIQVGDLGAFERRSFPGRARAAKEVDLSFRVKGPLVALPILVGSEVKQGELLARIDPRDFEVRLRNAEGQLQRARANLDRADSEYRRLQGIRKKDPELVSEVQLERAREAFELAKADNASLEATVDAARDELDYTHLRAPFDGAIVATYVQNHEYLQARQPVARLLDSQRIEFVIQIPETLISLVGQVQAIRVVFDALPDVELEAQILEIGGEASTVTRTYPVTLIMDQPAGAQVLPGMTGKVSGVIEGSADDRAVIVPVSAVFTTDADAASYVWVVAGDQTVSRREVEVGDLVSGGVVIENGLQAGETIATAGVHFLTDGQQVRPITE